MTLSQYYFSALVFTRILNTKQPKRMCVCAVLAKFLTLARFSNTLPNLLTPTALVHFPHTRPLPSRPPTLAHPVSFPMQRSEVATQSQQLTALVSTAAPDDKKKRTFETGATESPQDPDVNDRMYVYSRALVARNVTNVVLQSRA